MNKEDFFKLIKGNQSITKADRLMGFKGFTEAEVKYGIELFTDDAKNGLLYVDEFSFFCWQTTESFGERYCHELHLINHMYLTKYTAYDKESNKLLGFLYANEVKYFWEHNAYSEALLYIEKALDYGPSFSPVYLALLLTYYYFIIIKSDNTEEIPNVITRIEEVLNKKVPSRTYKFYLLLVLMEAYDKIGNSEKSDYYYGKLINLPEDSFHIDIRYYINIRRLYLESINNKGCNPSEEFIQKYRDCMSNVTYDNECINLYYHYVDIIRYVKGFIPDEEIRQDLINLIDSMRLVQDRIELYQYLLAGFDINNEILSDIQEKYRDDLSEYFTLNAKMQKYEIIGALDNAKQIKKYRDSANTDSLTGLGNRHAYDNDIDDLLNKMIIPDNLHTISMDLNGLKTVNDKYGHNAGDEFINSAAYILHSVLNDIGKVYRTGGDEFVALVYSDNIDLNKRFEKINELTKIWSEEHERALSISMGYADQNDCEKGLSREDLLKHMSQIADERMYDDKKRYYERTGIDRRRT